jgi:HAD superfamily hydrolase (TIGR01549 family)
MLQPNNLKAIIFDMDGTVFEYLDTAGNYTDGRYKGSEKQRRINANKIEFLKTQERTNNITKIESIIEESKESGIDSSEYFAKYYGIDIEVIKRIKFNFEASSILSFDQDLYDFVVDLKSKYKLFLVTGSPVFWADSVLGLLRIKEFFETIKADCYYPHLKKQAYKEILEDYNLKPSQTLVIGDSFVADIQPALDLGMLGLYTKRRELISDFGDHQKQNSNSV